MTDIQTEGADLIIERTFAAPPELVWRAFTEPEHITRWWGPAESSTTVLEMDVREGGRWRFINRSADGEQTPFKGEYLKIVAPEQLVQTFVLDVPGFDDQAVLEMTTFTATDDGTRVVTRSRFPSDATLAGAVNSGMARGATESYERLDVLLSEMAVR
ncbi:SRPBCC family protein [Micromonospora sp. NPDC047548]|uniref:SRPBCC family protein n=1 Tax=Micromonospora sp. NPDC047548 TaxID=3155624 RepID=UPI003411E823